MSRRLEIIATGPLATVQDIGRIGHLAVGVGRSGAADQGAYRLGARLLGNHPGTPAIEATLGGLRLRAHADLIVCLTGADAAATVDGRPVTAAAPVELRNGQLLTLGIPSAGLRTYVSVRGGLDVPLVLGSASCDTMSGLGGSPLQPGQVLTVGGATAEFPVVDHAALPQIPSGTVELDVLPGPRLNWFEDPNDLAATEWTVSSDSDRRGVRLEGSAITRRAERRDAELASEGMVRGAIQVPPGGQPVLFLNDHPVTGGYPVIGVLTPAAVDHAAQVRPGQSVRLRWLSR